MPQDVKVRVSGDVDQYERAIGRAQTATERYSNSLTSLELDLMRLQKQMDDDAAASLRKMEQAGETLGRGMLTAGAAIGAGLALAAREAIQWETAWAGVQKVTEGSPAQMAALEAELRQMATTLPATHDEIAAVAEAAGQLGVKRQDVAEFTRVMVAMGVSTNLTADEAATSMARFSNIMGTPISEVQRLGSAIVALGNDGASTEAEILEMGLRIAGAGRLVGLTEANVLALANAMSSMGINAEAGGTAISTVMTKIDNAVDQGGDAVEGFARLAGMSAQEFARLWNTEPPKAMLRLVGGLRHVEEQGGSTSLTLKDLGITEVRQLDTLNRLSGGYDVLADSLQTGDQAWKSNNALMDEAAKRYETTASKMQIAQNNLSELGIVLGETLLPAIGALAESATALLALFNGLPGPVKVGITVLGGLAATVGVLGGAALLAAPRIREAREALQTMGGAGGVARKSMSGMVGLLGGPWGIALTAGTVALGYFLSKSMDARQAVEDLKSTLDDQTGAMTDNTRAAVAKKLADEGIYDAAEVMGLALGDVTDAMLGNEDAQRRVNSQMEAGRDATLEARGKTVDYAVAMRTVQEALGGTNEALTEAITKKQQEIEALEQSAEATGEDAASKRDATEWTDQYGKVTAEVAGDVEDLEKQVRDLKESLDLLNEESISYEEAAIRFRDQIRGMSKEVEENGTSFKENTAAGDANRQMLLDGITDAKRAADAIFDKTVKEEGHEAAVRAANSSMRESIKTLRDEAVRLGIAEGKVDDYIAAQLGISPKEVTQYEAPGLDTNLARARELDRANDELDRTVTTTYRRINYVETKAPSLPWYGADQPKDGGLIADYSPVVGLQGGGRVSGPGGPRDDAAGLYALSNGEFVVNAAATSRHLPLLRDINAGRLSGAGGQRSTVNNFNMRSVDLNPRTFGSVQRAAALRERVGRPS